MEKDMCTDNASKEDMFAFENASWIVEGIIVIVINFCGLIANTLAIPVLLSRELTNGFNKMLAILAVFDATYNFLDILESIRSRHYAYFSDGSCGPTPYYIHLHDYLYYRLLYPLQHVFMMASIYTTIIVAFGRYIAVSKPISAFVQDGSDGWKRVILYTIPLLVFTFLWNLPKFFEFCAIVIESQCPDDYMPYNMCQYNKTLLLNRTTLMESFETQPNEEKCSLLVYADTSIKDVFIESMNVSGKIFNEVQWNVAKFSFNPNYITFYKNFGGNLISAVFPLVALGFLNYLVYKHLAKRRRRMSGLGLEVSKSQMNVENKQAQMLFGVIGLFFFGHLFRIVLNVNDIYLFSFRKIDPATNCDCAAEIPLYAMVFQTISRTLLSVSHSGNLCVYCVSNKTFRKHFYLQICCLFGRASMSRRRSTNPDIAITNVDNTATFELTTFGRRISIISGIRRLSDIIDSRRNSNMSSNKSISNGSRNTLAQNELSEIKEEMHSCLDNNTLLK